MYHIPIKLTKIKDLEFLQNTQLSESDRCEADQTFSEIPQGAFNA